MSRSNPNSAKKPSPFLKGDRGGFLAAWHLEGENVPNPCGNRFSIDKARLYCKITGKSAGIAQLVEPHVANVIVAGSSPVSRSTRN